MDAISMLYFLENGKELREIIKYATLRSTCFILDL